MTSRRAAEGPAAPFARALARLQGPLQTEVREVALAVLLLLLAGLLTRAVARQPFFYDFAPGTPWHIQQSSASSLMGTLVALAALSLAAGFVRLSELPRPFAVVHRATTGVLLFYAAASAPPSFGGSAQLDDRLGWLALGRLLALACGLLALWRPSFGLPLCCYTVWYRNELDAIHDLAWPAVMWDYVPIVYLGLFLTWGAPLASLVRRAARRWSIPELSGEPAAAGRVSLHLLRLSIAVYFANYFRSGLGKLQLDGGSWTWLLENDTPALLLTAREVGTAMLPDPAAASLFEVLQHAGPQINTLTLLIEMGVLVTVVRPAWTAVSAIAMVLFHSTIFLLTGILFWKWMAVDVGIAWAAWRIGRQPTSWLAGLACVMVVWYTPRYVPTANLSWYDTRSLNDAYFVALTVDGSEYRVPSTYFLAASSAMDQMRCCFDALEVKLPVSTYGTTRQYGVMRYGNACELPGVRSADPRVWPRLERFVRWHHHVALEGAGDDGLVHYQRFPHHIWSYPARYREFARLDKRRIHAYRFVNELKCTGFADGRFETRVLHRVSREVSVRPPPPAPR